MDNKSDQIAISLVIILVSCAVILGLNVMSSAKDGIPLEYRVKELERKVSGMQTEINKLHAVLFDHKSINHPISWDSECVPSIYPDVIGVSDRDEVIELFTPHGKL